MAEPIKSDKAKEGTFQEVRESEFLVQARNGVNKLALDAMNFLRMMLPVPSDENTRVLSYSLHWSLLSFVTYLLLEMNELGVD